MTTVRVAGRETMTPGRVIDHLRAEHARLVDENARLYALYVESRKEARQLRAELMAEVSQRPYFADEIAREMRKARILFPEPTSVKEARLDTLANEVRSFELSHARDPQLRIRAEQKKAQATRKETGRGTH